jgi:hypothetical protein
LERRFFDFAVAFGGYRRSLCVAIASALSHLTAGIAKAPAEKKQQLIDFKKQMESR